MNLDPDLQRILNIGAKVYDTKTSKQGKVIALDKNSIQVDYGHSTRRDIVDYEYAEFCDLLTSDTIVANYRLPLGVNNGFKINPRVNIESITSTVVHKEPVYGSPLSNTGFNIQKSDLPKQKDLEIAYVNFSTGRFSTEPKKGYTKVEYKKATEKVTIEVDSDGLEKLREMGLIK
jgi:hypothetical protein